MRLKTGFLSPRQRVFCKHFLSKIQIFKYWLHRRFSLSRKTLYVAVLSLMTCQVLLHLRHLYHWSCPFCLEVALMESEKKAGDKKPNARGTIASTSQGGIERSTREMLADPHCSQCSVKGFCFIFLSLLSSGCVLIAELGASLPARNAPDCPLWKNEPPPNWA